MSERTHFVSSLEARRGHLSPLPPELHISLFWELWSAGLGSVSQQSHTLESSFQPQDTYVPARAVPVLISLPCGSCQASLKVHLSSLLGRMVLSNHIKIDVCKEQALYPHSLISISPASPGINIKYI